MSHSAATLQTPDGHYVTPVNGGGIGENGNNTEPIHIDATTIGPYEQFSVGQALRPRATGTSYDPGRGPRMTDRRLTARAIPPSPGRTDDNDPPSPGAHRRQRPVRLGMREHVTAGGCLVHTRRAAETTGRARSGSHSDVAHRA
jgi:hypothetical protein